MLNSRLQACAAYVGHGGTVCDVGTDHAQLAVYLITQGIAARVIASDIGEGPLAAAQRTIEKAGLTAEIRTILSDGLQNIPPQGVTDIVIAGMGGETMVHILEHSPFPLHGMRLILQPMTKADILRQWLYRNGFAITEETCVRDERFLYAVMCAAYTGECIEPDYALMRIGRMDLHNPDCLAYAQRQYTMLCKSRDGRISAGQNPAPFDTAAADVKRRLEEIQK
jgi:tRNA (adenine22-N1)-methyltransferase